jgi:hypothetical protein
MSETCACLLGLPVLPAGANGVQQPARSSSELCRATADSEGVKEVEYIADMIAAAPLDDGREWGGVCVWGGGAFHWKGVACACRSGGMRGGGETWRGMCACFA